MSELEIRAPQVSRFTCCAGCLGSPVEQHRCGSLTFSTKRVMRLALRRFANLQPAVALSSLLISRHISGVDGGSQGWSWALGDLSSHFSVDFDLAFIHGSDSLATLCLLCQQRSDGHLRCCLSIVWGLGLASYSDASKIINTPTHSSNNIITLKFSPRTMETETRIYRIFCLLPTSSAEKDKGEC